MKYPFKPLGMLKTDILDEFCRQVEECWHASDCGDITPENCDKLSCWCLAASKIGKKEKVSADDIGILICQTEISFLSGMSVSELHSIYLADVAFSKYLNEWSASLNETASIESATESMETHHPDHDELKLKASEISMQRISLAEKILGRSIMRKNSTGEKKMVIATDIFLHSKHHPFYAELIEKEICFGTTVSEIDIVSHLYSEHGYSPRQIWEIWQCIFVDVVAEFLPLTKETLDITRQIEARLENS